MNKILLAASVTFTAFCLASCSSDDDAMQQSENQSHMVTYHLTCDIENGSDTATTRTYFSALSSEMNEICWNENEKISVFYYGTDDNTGYVEFSIEKGAGTRSGTFTGTLPDTNTGITALSPCQTTAQWNTTTIISNITLPSAQTATAGSPDPSATIMVAKSAANGLNDTLSFYNVCSYIKITPAFDCKSITIRSKNDNDVISGVYSSYDIQTNAGTPNANKSYPYVTLYGDIKANTTYYIAINPGTFASGISVSANTGEKMRTVGNTASLTFDRSKFYDYSATVATAPSTDLFVDLGLTSGTLWARCNVGAVTPQDRGILSQWDTSLPNTIWQNGSTLPTEAQVEELLAQTTATYTENYKNSGINGWTFTSKTNSNSIFMPLCGYRTDESSGLTSNNSTADYWTSAEGSTSGNAICFTLNQGTESTGPRSQKTTTFCLAMRPVKTKVAQ